MLQSGFYSRRGTSGRDQQARAVRPLHQLGEQKIQRGRFVAKQAYQSLICLRSHSDLAQPGVAVELVLALQQIGLAQQSTGALVETRVIEMLGPAAGRARHHGGGQAVRTLHIRFGAEVLQIDPHGRFYIILACSPRRICAGSYEFRSNLATKALHPYVGRRQCGQYWGAGAVSPGMHGHPQPVSRQRARCHPLQGRCVVHPQPHRVAARCQVGAQTPAHPDVAKVVDHAAEHIPQQGGLRSRWVGVWSGRFHGRHCQ